MTIEYVPEGKVIDATEYGAIEDDIMRVFDHYKCDDSDVMNVLTNVLCIMALTAQFQKSQLQEAVSNIYDFHDSCMAESQTLQ